VKIPIAKEDSPASEMQIFGGRTRGAGGPAKGRGKKKKTAHGTKEKEKFRRGKK